MKGTKITHYDKEGNPTEELIPEGSELFSIHTRLDDIEEKLEQIKDLITTKWEK